MGDIPKTVMTTRAPPMLKINQNSLQRGRAGKKWEFLTEIFFRDDSEKDNISFPSPRGLRTGQ